MANLTRYYMLTQIGEYFKRPMRGKILGISGIENFRPLISDDSEVLDVHYPEVDMQRLPYENESFDCVISDQVIEHLENPEQALSETYRVLKKGGVAVHTTCFINYVHYGPKDYWRFSSEGLRYLCRNFATIHQCAGWGNRFAILLCFLGDIFRGMNIPENGVGIRRALATYNEPRYPIVTWIIAEK